MIRFLGSVCIFSGGLMTVLLQLRERRRTRTALAELLSALRRMGEEVRLCRTPLPRLLQTLSASCSGDAAAFFSAVGDALRRGEDVETLWREHAARLLLPVAAQQALSEVGSALHGDEESVCKAISLAILELEQCAAEWDKQRPETEKRTAALWLSGAALLVILLI